MLLQFSFFFLNLANLVLAHKVGGSKEKEHHDHSTHDHAAHDHSSHSHEESLQSAIDECSIEGVSDYDLPMHVAALVILVVVSMLGSLSPILVSFFYERKKPNLQSLFIIKCGVLFGAGTILATAFVHMFTGAVQNLTHECVHEFFKEYPSFAGLFAMIAILLVHLLQYVIKQSFKHGEADEKHCHSVSLEERIHVKRVTVAILEVGVAIHSVIIGIALGTSSGPEFTTLLIALCFHQFFEGLALGSTISAAGYKSKVKSFLMGAIYAVTTPLGIAIGIALHSTWNENSPQGLLIQGIFDSCSAGILIYSALVEFLVNDITNSREFAEQSLSKQFVGFCCVYAGATTMAVIGKFA